MQHVFGPALSACKMVLHDIEFIIISYPHDVVWRHSSVQNHLILSVFLHMECKPEDASSPSDGQLIVQKT